MKLFKSMFPIDKLFYQQVESNSGFPSIHTDLLKQIYRPNTDLLFDRIQTFYRPGDEWNTDLVRQICDFSHFPKNSDKGGSSNQYSFIYLQILHYFIIQWGRLLVTSWIIQQAIFCILIVNLWKIPILQTFWHKYRPFTDPKMPKGLYYRPRSVNTDPLGNPRTVLHAQTCAYMH